MDYTRQSVFERFLRAQRSRIESDKRRSHTETSAITDDQYAEWWVQEGRSESFRDVWERSCCSECCLASACGYEVRTSCDNFISHSERCSASDINIGVPD